MIFYEIIKYAKIFYEIIKYAKIFYEIIKYFVYFIMEKIENELCVKFCYNNIIKKLGMIDLFVSQYKLLSVIRENSKKCVCIVQDNNDKKFIMKAKLNSFLFPNEIEIYKTLKKNPQKNVIKIEKLLISKSFFIVIYDYISGFNMASIKNFHHLDSEIENIFIETMSAISFIHSLGIYHGDIKPDNIIITKINDKYVPIIIDFDFSSFITDEIKNNDIIKTTSSFYFYFFHNKITSKDLNNIDIDFDLIETYVGKNKKLVGIIGWILKHSYELCPSINDIIEKLNC
jgi:serine/threonine protein kinase